MNFYADFPARRARQIAADIVAVIVVVTAIVVGVVVRNAIAALGRIGARLEEAGRGFESTMGEIGEKLGGMPLIGDGIRGPFDTAAGAGESIADAGRTGQAAVEAVAAFAGVGVAFAPIALLLLVWVWPRVRFARRAAETRALLRLADGEQLLALRALDAAGASELVAVSPRAVSGWRAGDSDVIRGLATLEARRTGVRLPEPGGARPVD